MVAGGTINVKTYSNDLSQIDALQYPAMQLISLPLLNSPEFAGKPGINGYAGLVNGAINVSAYTITTIPIVAPATGLTLVSNGFDEQGNYHVACPNGEQQPTETDYWACGYARFNGIGAWLPLSLMPTLWPAAGPQGWWGGGFGSVSGAFRKIEWIGFNQGCAARGSSATPEMLAILSINWSLVAPVAGQGDTRAYAFPDANAK
jgi:hypothetical protein